MKKSKKQKSGHRRFHRLQLRRQEKKQRRLKVGRWYVSFSRRTWSIIVGISVLVTIAGGVYAFAPKVSVHSSESLNPADPFSTPFIITNESALALHNLTMSCEVDNLEGLTSEGCESCPAMGLSGFGTEDSQPIPEFQPGEQATLLCSGMSFSTPRGDFGPEDTKNAVVTITVKYRPDLSFWTQEKKFRFGTAPTANGQLIWIPMAKEMPGQSTPTSSVLQPLHTESPK